MLAALGGIDAALGRGRSRPLSPRRQDSLRHVYRQWRARHSPPALRQQGQLVPNERLHSWLRIDPHALMQTRPPVPPSPVAAAVSSTSGGDSLTREGEESTQMKKGSLSVGVSRGFQLLGNEADTFHGDETFSFRVLVSCKNFKSTHVANLFNVHDTSYKTPLRLALLALTKPTKRIL